MRLLLKLMLLMTAVPILELVLLVKISQWSGSVWLTIAIVIITGATGAWLAKNQGLRTIRLIQEDLAEGRLPTDKILDGLLILVAAALLLTPGLLTDVVGLLLLVPPARAIARAWIKIWAAQRFKIAASTAFASQSEYGRDGEEMRDVEVDVK